ncbi:MAG: hypothetical protein ACXADW_02665 [Candidatus Hodarchaeales archaeon]|jgi:hypothetical protein
MEKQEATENIDISDTVAEITTVISKHLTKVIEKVSNKNNDASQNMEILNQLPIVKNLRSENETMRQEMKKLQDKYKKALEELIQIKSKEKITMEITELEKPVAESNVSVEEILKDMKENNSSKPITLWGIDDVEGSDDEDDDAQPLLSNGLLSLNFSEEDNELRQESKNADVSADEERLAIDNWVNFHKDKLDVDCTKSDDDILLDIMKSSAGIKGWSFKASHKKQSKLTLNSFAHLEEDEEENAEDDEEDDEEDEEEEDEDEEEEVVEEEDEEEDDDNAGEDDDEQDNTDTKDKEEEPKYIMGALIAQKNNADIIDDGDSSENENDDEEEEIELDEYEFEGSTYYTEDPKNGNLYECLEDGEIGDIVGHLENGSVFFS